MSSYASRTCRRAPSPRHTLSMTSVRAMRYTPEPSLLTALQAVPHRAPPAHSNEHRDRVTPTTAIRTDHRAASSHRGGSGQRWDRSAILHIPSEDLQGGEKYPSSTRRHWPHIYNEGLWRSSMIKRHNRPWFKFRFWREFEFGRCDIPPIHRRLRSAYPPYIRNHKMRQTATPRKTMAFRMYAATVTRQPHESPQPPRYVARGRRPRQTTAPLMAAHRRLYSRYTLKNN